MTRVRPDSVLANSSTQLNEKGKRKNLRNQLQRSLLVEGLQKRELLAADFNFEATADYSLELLHFSDQEASTSAIQDAPRLSAVLNALRAQDLGADGLADNTLTVSSGDAIIPGLFASASAPVFGSRAIGDIQIQNELGIQAMALGNHEFDWGTEVLAGLIDGSAPGSILGSDFGGTDFPYLSANLDFSTDANMAPLAVPGGAAPVGNKVTSSTVIDVNGENIGVVGATTPTLEVISNPGSVGIAPASFGANPTSGELDALAAEIQAEVDALTAADPSLDKIVLLAHMQQINIEEELAARLQDVDIIVAGGSNTRLFDSNDRARDGDSNQGTYPKFIDNASGSTTAVVNTDGSYKYVGRLVIDFDTAGNIIPGSYDPAVSGAYATDAQGVSDLGAGGLVDPEIQIIVNAIEAELIATESNVFGISEVFLNGNRSGADTPTDPDGVRTQETNLGNLSADANLAAAKASDPSVMVSFKNGGGIRASIGQIVVPPGGTDAVRLPNEPVVDGSGNVIKPAGGISQNDIATTLAFNNGLTLLTLTRAELVDVLEHGVGAIPGVSGRFPQVSGVRFSYNPAEPAGDRLVNATIVNDAGSPVAELMSDGRLVGDPNEEFRIVTLNFLAGGGDGYPFPITDPSEPGYDPAKAARANRVDLEQEGVQTGDATFADDGTEQDALAEYLEDNFLATPYTEADRGRIDDTRIQNTQFQPTHFDQIGRLSGLAGAEITAFDSASNRVFVTGAVEDAATGDDRPVIQVFDLSDPTNPTVDQNLDLVDLGLTDLNGAVNSVSVKNGWLAAAVTGSNEQAPGTVAIFDAGSLALEGTQTVGALPDMVTFNHAGTKILVANEGEANGTDPAGSISIIDLSGGVAGATTSTVDFTAFNGREDELRAEGVRIFPGKSTSEDLEPEYIAIAPNDSQAFVTLQENNAVAVLDLINDTLVDIVALGLKDHSAPGNGLDSSDRDGKINIQNRPVFGMFMPDAIAAFQAGPDTFYVTANEGDARSEDSRIKDLNLDPAFFTNPLDLQRDEKMGRLEASTIDGVSPNKIFVAELDGAQETVPGDPNASGKAVLSLSPDGQTLNYAVTVTGLDWGAIAGGDDQTADPNDNVAAIHIHNAARGVNGGVAFGILSPEQDTDDLDITFNDDGSVTLQGAWEETDSASSALSNFLADLQAANAGDDVPLYFNIHTTGFVQGAIRGQIVGAEGGHSKLHTYGSRSFSIWDSAGKQVFDSADEIARITAELTPELFNANDGDPAEFDNRSDNKGAEPEGVTIGQIDGRTYAFVGLERAGGGVLVYDISNPLNPNFVQYLRNNDDVAPEGLVFVGGEDSPNGKPLLIVTNEESNSMTVYSDLLQGSPALARESFEFPENHPNSNYTLTTQFDDGADHFGRFDVRDDSNPDRSEFRSGFDGNWAIFSQDNDGTGQSATQVITLPEINVRGFSNLMASFSLGALDSEREGFNNFEADNGDGIKIFATIDGGERVQVGQFSPPEIGARDTEGAGDLYEDRDFDGIGEGRRLTTHLSDFFFPVMATGSVLTIEVEITSTNSFESIAVDDFRLTGDQSFKLQVLHASDLEGGVDAVDRAASFAAIVEALEAEANSSGYGSLLLSAGDNYIPGPFFNASGDRATFRDGGIFNDTYNTLFGTTDYNGLREGVGRVDISIMNVLGFDASAIGNHEFDQGSDAFESIIEEDFRSPDGPASDRWVGAQFPYLSANIDFSNDPDLANLFTSDILPSDAFATGPAQSAAGNSSVPKLAPATKILVDGEWVGVVGATTQLLELISSPGKSEIKGPSENDMVQLASVLQPVIDDLIDGDDDQAGNGDDVNKVILVSHLQQIALETELIELLSGVDLVIAGGSDTLLADSTDVLRGGDSADGDYPLITTNKDGEPAAIVSTDGEYSYVGRLVVEFDANGILQPQSIQETVSGAYATDEAGVLAATGAASLDAAIAASVKATEIKKLTDAVSGVVTAKDGNIVGRTGVFIEGRRSSVRTEETNMGNLTADANLAAAQAFDSSVQISLKNGGGIRAEIGSIDGFTGELLPPGGNPAAGKLPGEISQLDVENSLRFNNGLTLMTVTADELKQLLEHGVADSSPGSTPGRFPQVSGLHFSFDPSAQAIAFDSDGNVSTPGERVQSLAIVDDLGNVTDVLVENGSVVGDPARAIRLVTLDFLWGAFTAPDSPFGGDGYPFKKFGDDVIQLRDVLTEPGASTFASPGSEQDALAEHLLAKHSVVPFYTSETDASQDRRIQNLANRNDAVLDEVATEELPVNRISTIGEDDGIIGAEISAFDPTTNSLFVTSGDGLQVIDFSDPTTPVVTGLIDPSVNGAQGREVTSVAVGHGPTEGVVAFAVPDANEQDPGRVMYYSTADLSFLGSTIVGALPDQLTFSPDGSRLLVANEGQPTDEGRLGSMMKGLNGFDVEAIFTVGDVIPNTTGALNHTTAGDYQPVGILDGLGAYELDENTIRVFANHELTSAAGYAYELANRTTLTGARISYFDIDKKTRDVIDAGMAYDLIINAQGVPVTDFNKHTLGDGGGISRFCSGIFVEEGTYNFVDNIYFAGEEDSNANGGRGGLEYALDVEEGVIYALPSLGYAAWENVTPIDTGNPEKTSLLVGDDRGGAPLYLWVGNKGLDADGNPSNDFISRNGLSNGTLYAWKADSGETTPEEFNGTGESRTGTWVAMTDLSSIANQDAEILANGSFRFSRPEDLATDPTDGTRAVMASTGRDRLFPSDAWGTTYLIDIDFTPEGDPTVAKLDVIYDGDDGGKGQFAHPDFGMRSPDNLDWADDGLIYLQEDRSVGGFGDISGEEASIWRLDPNNGLLERVGQIDRTLVLPEGSTDGDPTDVGDWESSGILDVSNLFGELPGSTFLIDVQAHSIRDGVIADANLVQGGQLSIISTSAPRQSLTAPSMMSGLGGWEVEPIFTVGTTLTGTTGALNSGTAGDYQPPGILDGLGAYELNDTTIRVFANHELVSSQGYAYPLANGSTLIGSRISYFDIDKETREVIDSGMAYDTIINANGVEVDDANKGEIGDGGGISRFCSGIMVQAGTFNFVDDIYFAGEEDSNANGGRGGLEYALDVEEGVIYALPSLGYAAWENVTPIDTGNPDKTALLVGDDRGGAPLYLWVGNKGLDADGNAATDFVSRNGLANGTLYAWKADSGETTPEDGFLGTGASRTGTWVAMTDLSSIANQDAEILANGSFRFSRPEDVATDPTDGTRAVMASTGRSSLFPSDSWGTTYLIDIDFDASGTPTVAKLDVIYDGDDAGAGQFAHPDFGMRSPDNLDWADDGMIYLQEDRSIGGFGDVSGEEASIWKLNPNDGKLTRIGQIDRSAVLPMGSTDGDPTDLGDWESSGILDVSTLFGDAPGTTFLFDVQAHSVRDGAIGGNELLAQGGQLSFMYAPATRSMMSGLGGWEVEPIFTVGTTLTGTTGALNSGTAGDYQPPGILDGLGAYELNDTTIRVFANHELVSSQGYAYPLANGSTLIGSRISYFDIDKETREVIDSGMAYDTIINANGVEVDDANKGEIGDGGGISRFCSGIMVQAGTFNFVDDIYFAGEEDSNANGGRGGLEYALDVEEGVIYALPSLGYAAWENVTPIDTGNPDKTALLVGDDRGGAPLYLWVGNKGLDADGNAATDFVSRNGLANGTLYAWKADSGETTPEDGFLGTGASRTGTWVAMTDLSSIANQDAEILANGSFRFSRPEDVATDPTDGTRAVMASTGRSSLFPSDSWGTTYLIDIDFDASGTPTVAKLDVIYDGDDAGAGQFAHPDFGMRSPDNLDWADDGMIYLQEDRSIGGFGDVSGEEASIWKLNPNDGKLTRIGQIDRSAVLPMGSTDGDPTDLGDWESSGILDVSTLFGDAPGTTFLFDVQAHSVRDGAIGGNELLAQGGQLSFMYAPEFRDSSMDSPEDPNGSVSIIDLSNGILQATVQTATFDSFNGQERVLRNEGVRIFPGKTASQDFEPEYVTVSPDGTTAYVALQENNALGVLDIASAKFTDILPLGLKDHTALFNAMDPSNEDGGINFRNVPVFGMYQPDAIASYEFDGQTYIVSANEGDGRDIDEERADDDLVLDPQTFPFASDIQTEDVLGRLKASRFDGDTDGDGDIDRIHVFGGRSFSIWDAEGNQVFDSGNFMERFTQLNGSFVDNRSDDKGPEPEGVTLATIGDLTYAFVGLERSHDVLIFNITDPADVKYVNSFSNEGDLEPEGLTFIPADESPTGYDLLVITNEDSNTITTVGLAPRLVVDISDVMISENGGTATATVTREGDLSSELVVMLMSNDTTEATVPEKVTIPAGASFVEFVITGVDDDEFDNIQVVEIKATAEGYIADMDTIEVFDDDGDTPVVTSVEVSGGESQRSIIRSLTVNFNTDVTLDPGAITLENIDTGEVLDQSQLIITPSTGAANSFEITFAIGTSVRERDNGEHALADGNYQLSIDSRKVISSTGNNMLTDHVFGDEFDDDLYALFGDKDGSSEVDILDFIGLFAAFSTGPYDKDFDFDGDGGTQFDFDDAFAFVENFNTARRNF